MKKLLVVLLLSLPAAAMSAERIPVIFDTDFVMPPWDDKLQQQ